MGWLSDFREFSGETSAHGVKYIFHGYHKIVKILFLLLWLVAVGYSMYVLSKSLVSYIGKPTGTKFQVVAEEKDKEIASKIQFPTISVCSHNVVSKSYLASEDGLEELMVMVDNWDPEETEAMDFNSTEYSKYRNMTYEDVIKNGGPPDWTFLQCESFINLCQSVLSAQDFYEREASVSGNCFRINPNGKLYGKQGNYGKMQLMFFADLNDYSNMTRREPQYGYTVVFHDHESYSSTTPSGFWMSPGSIYKVDLSMTHEYREGPPAGNCDPTRVNNTYGRYEENSCYAQCRDDAMMEACGCVFISPPEPENVPDTDYPACTLEQWAKCGLRAYKDWVMQFADVNNIKPMCYCPPTCKEISYDAQISSSSLSKFYAESKTGRLPPGYSTREDVMENLLIIDILFTSMRTSEIREIITYGWGNFLGDVGGVLGLFLGASAFTVIEFAQFIIYAICKYCCGLCKGKEGEKPVPYQLTET